MIAIENVRLFNETKDALAKVEERTRELTESLDYQTAISDVLRCISESPTDVTPVFEAILESATRLFGAPMAAALRYDGQQVHLVATRNWSTEALEDAHRFYPGPPNPKQLSGRVVLSGCVQTVEDTLPRPGLRPDPGPARPLATHARRATAQGWRRHRCDHRDLAGPRQDAAAAVRSAEDLRGPGGDRHRERAPDQRDEGSRSTTADRRDRPKCCKVHQRIADRRDSRCSKRSSQSVSRLLRRRRLRLRFRYDGDQTCASFDRAKRWSTRRRAATPAATMLRDRARRSLSGPRRARSGTVQTEDVTRCSTPNYDHDVRPAPRTRWRIPRCLGVPMFRDGQSRRARSSLPGRTRAATLFAAARSTC